MVDSGKLLVDKVSVFATQRAFLTLTETHFKFLIFEKFKYPCVLILTQGNSTHTGTYRRQEESARSLTI